MTVIKFWCQAKTEDAHREIKVDTVGLVATCSCKLHQPGHFCAHLDATLIAGERHMVPQDDHAKADKAMVAMAGNIAAPLGWKAAWRNNMSWRGLSKPRIPRLLVDHSLEHGDDYYERPKICFTGTGPIKRKDLLEQARVAGWQAVDDVQRGLRVLVAEDPTRDVSKLQKARKQAIPIISYEEWATLTLEGEMI